MQGRIALITGGTKGLGKAMALELARRGAKVYVNYSGDDEAARATESELKTLGNSGQALKADVSDLAQVEAMIQELTAEAGGLDILINNAGLVRDGMLMMMPPENWRRVIDVNLGGTFNCSRTALRPMVEKRWGRIVNLISPSAIMGRQGQCNYSASKGGILSFTRSLAREVARLGITVNALSPGVIETELSGTLKPRAREELLGMIPLGRFGLPEEVAHGAAFLVSEQARYITGQTIAIDGGIT
jgi:3-oxoacyl-[acyl-carrier protein] reductase